MRCGTWVRASIRAVMSGLTTAAAIAVATPAAAGEMAVGQLVGVESQSECMERARRAVYAYRDRFGASAIIEDSWTIYLFDADNNGFDVVVMCPLIEERAAAFAAVHGAEDTRPLEVLERLQQVWR